MQFNLIAFIFNPLVLLFATMALGNLFGELKFRKFKFGITGTLFIGLGIGYFLTRYAATFAKGSKYYASAMKVMQGKVIDGSLMNLALLIFIVGTGLLAAKDMKYAINKFGKQFVALAIFIPFVGAVASYGFSQALDNLSPFQITGTYTGALTSSAGLAAATESSDSESRRLAQDFANQSQKAQKKILAIVNGAKVRDAKLRGTAVPDTMTLENTKSLSQEDVEVFVTEAKAGVGVGHSIGYPFGVLFLILGINVIPKIFGFDVEEEKKKRRSTLPKRPSISRTMKNWRLPPCRKFPWILSGSPWRRSWAMCWVPSRFTWGPWGCSPWVPPAVPSWFPWVWVPSGRWGL